MTIVITCHVMGWHGSNRFGSRTGRTATARHTVFVDSTGALPRNLRDRWVRRDDGTAAMRRILGGTCNSSASQRRRGRSHRGRCCLGSSRTRRSFFLFGFLLASWFRFHVRAHLGEQSQRVTVFLLLVFVICSRLLFFLGRCLGTIFLARRWLPRRRSCCRFEDLTMNGQSTSGRSRALGVFRRRSGRSAHRSGVTRSSASTSRRVGQRTGRRSCRRWRKVTMSIRRRTCIMSFVGRLIGRRSAR